MEGMNSRSAMRNVVMALVASLALAACGSSSSDSETQQQVPTATTGTVGLLFTDKPTDDYSSIILTVSEAVLIGGDDSQQILFQGEEHYIDLLDLTNYNEPVMFGEVEAGNYTKIRLMIDAIELVPMDGSDAFFIEKLPANGKVDLLHPEGFDILPGRTVMIEIDVDANKSIKITDAGKSGKVNFRPVVRVNIYDGGLPDKLARLEGAVSGEPNATDGTFVLCSIDAPDYCVDIATDTMTSYFDGEGLDTNFGALTDGAMAVAFGQYSTDPSVVLNAVLVEIGSNPEQITGEVVTEPASSQFLVLTINGIDITVELQPGTKYYDESGPVAADAVVLGARVEVEGVKPVDADPELIRAAIVFLEAREDDLLSGTIMDPIEAGPPQTFVLATESGDRNVCVLDDATILFVDAANATVTVGTFAELAVDDVVELFGEMAGDDSCFEANEVIVEVPEVTEAP